MITYTEPSAVLHDSQAEMMMMNNLKCEIVSMLGEYCVPLSIMRRSDITEHKVMRDVNTDELFIVTDHIEPYPRVGSDVSHRLASTVKSYVATIETSMMDLGRFVKPGAAYLDSQMALMETIFAHVYRDIIYSANSDMLGQILDVTREHQLAGAGTLEDDCRVARYHMEHSRALERYVTSTGRISTFTADALSTKPVIHRLGPYCVPTVCMRDHDVLKDYLLALAAPTAGYVYSGDPVVDIYGAFQRLRITVTWPMAMSVCPDRVICVRRSST